MKMILTRQPEQTSENDLDASARETSVSGRHQQESRISRNLEKYWPRSLPLARKNWIFILFLFSIFKILKKKFSFSSRFMRIWNINLVLFSIKIKNSRQALYVCGINNMCLIMRCLKVKWIVSVKLKVPFLETPCISRVICDWPKLIQNQFCD